MNYQEALEQLDLKVQERLKFLFELIACSHERLNHWIYDSEGYLLASNCDDEYFFNLLFSKGCFNRYAMEYGREHDMPYILGSYLGNIWGVVYVRPKGKLSTFHVLGPVFLDNISDKNLNKAVASYDLQPSFSIRLSRELKKISIVPWNDFSKYILLLHYALNDERITSSDFFYQPGILEITSRTLNGAMSQEQPEEQPSRPWLAEQALMNNIREGNLNFRQALARAGMVSSGVQIDVGDPLKKNRISSCVFTALCARAAIEGGLPAQTAYFVQNMYTQNAMNANEISQLVDINHQMYEDYIRRVHKLKQKPGISPQIRKCMDYIEMHPYEKISISDLAASVGYTDYYFSRKFKKQAGCSPHDYILEQKMRCARNLLSTTDLDVQEISEQLHFCSRSYFTDNFRKIFGISPTEYRRKNRQI